MMKRIASRVSVLLLSMTMAVTAWAITLEEAARQAARQYDAKVLSARTVNRKGERIHEIKLLTREGVVKTVRIPEGQRR